MKTHLVLSVAVLSLGLTVAQAYAEGEGNGEPFAFRAHAHAKPAAAFAADTGSNPYPELSGRLTQQVSETRMVAVGGSEAPVQSVSSTAHGFEEGTVPYVQARNLERHEASRQPPVMVAKAASAVR